MCECLGEEGSKRQDAAKNKLQQYKIKSQKWTFCHLDFSVDDVLNPG